MEVCKNKKSNRYFIYLKDPEAVDNRALLITPEGIPFLMGRWVEEKR